ncbi:MAG: hypothetical protein JRD71_06225 [Deltaproteobacteria bacterium]|nr:hypothetical protein [Deltaproteobacteria bacterium]
MDVFSILAPGGYTTVQDKGRYGYQQMGIPVSGVLDSFAFRVANMLVGNPISCAVLEITVMGPRFEVLSGAHNRCGNGDDFKRSAGSRLEVYKGKAWEYFRNQPGEKRLSCLSCSKRRH